MARTLQLLVWLFLLFSRTLAFSLITQDADHKRLTITDGSGQLVLRLNYDGKCMLDQVVVRGQSVVPEATGVYSAITISNHQYTTRAGLASPRVKVSGNSTTISGIRFRGGGMQVAETWRFTTYADRIVWRISRTYLSAGTLDDTGFPGWDFSGMSTWTGALLGHGGVAWCKLFDSPNASYGVHNGTVAFWNADSRVGLRIIPRASSPSKVAVRFSRQPSGAFSVDYSLSDHLLAPKHGRSLFQRAHQDIWAPFQVL